mgnify:FL=1
MKNIKGKVFYTLVNYESNKALAEEIPHIKFHGLMMVFHYVLKRTPKELNSTLITNKDLAKWEITKDQILLEAKETTPKLFVPELQRIGLRSTGKPLPVYNLTTTNGTNGVAVLFYDDELKRLAEKIGSGFYVVTTEQDSCILLAQPEGEDYDKINKAFNTGNSFCNKIFYYDPEEGKLRIARKSKAK